MMYVAAERKEIRRQYVESLPAGYFTKDQQMQLLLRFENIANQFTLSHYDSLEEYLKNLGDIMYDSGHNEHKRIIALAKLGTIKGIDDVLNPNEEAEKKEELIQKKTEFFFAILYGDSANSSYIADLPGAAINTDDNARAEVNAASDNEEVNLPNEFGPPPSLHDPLPAFEKALEELYTKAISLEDETAYSEATKLHRILETEYKHYCDGVKTLMEFKSESTKHIEGAHTVLDQHRGWKEVLSNLAIMLSTCGLAGLYNLVTSGHFFFSVKTDTAVKLDGLTASLAQDEIAPDDGAADAISLSA